MPYIVVFLLLTACSTPGTYSGPISPRLTPSEKTRDMFPEFKSEIKSGNSLRGAVVNCQDERIVVEYYLNYGPENIEILNHETQEWQTFTLDQCEIIGYEPL